MANHGASRGCDGGVRRGRIERRHRASSRTNVHLEQGQSGLAAAHRKQMEPRGFIPIEGFSPLYLEVGPARGLNRALKRVNK